jgi:uncharacterized membrane protein YdbT with pleckstrin-like domain
MTRYDEGLLTDDESVVLELRPHWRVLLPASAWALGSVGLLVTAYVLRGRVALLSWALVVVAVAVLAAFTVPPIVRWFFTDYILTTERIIVRRGWIARSGTEIPLESINNVLFSQTVVERVLGYGDVLLESAGESGQSRLRDVPDPEHFQAAVYRVREDRSLHFSRGPATGPRDVVAQLEALAELHERGKLTDDEFAAQKARLLAG